MTARAGWYVLLFKIITKIRLRSEKIQISTLSVDMSGHGINGKFIGIVSAVCTFASFDYNFIWQTYDCTALFINCPLLHTQMIRACSRNHMRFSVFNLADICIIDGNRLIFAKRIGTVFFSVYSDSDTAIVTFIKKGHSSPEDQCKDKNPADKQYFFFLQKTYLCFLYNSWKITHGNHNMKETE